MHYRQHLASIPLNSLKTSCREKSFAPKFVRPQRSLLGGNNLGVRASHKGAGFTLPKVTRSGIVSTGYAGGILKMADNIRRFVSEPVSKSAH